MKFSHVNIQEEYSRIIVNVQVLSLVQAVGVEWVGDMKPKVGNRK